MKKTYYDYYPFNLDYNDDDEKYLNQDELNKLTLLLKFLYDDVNREPIELTEKDIADIDKMRRRLNMIIKLNLNLSEIKKNYNT